jgi:hypothetical protein
MEVPAGANHADKIFAIVVSGPADTDVLARHIKQGHVSIVANSLIL